MSGVQRGPWVVLRSTHRVGPLLQSDPRAGRAEAPGQGGARGGGVRSGYGWKGGTGGGVAGGVRSPELAEVRDALRREAGQAALELLVVNQAPGNKQMSSSHTLQQIYYI
jgi:hypothetical protein